MGKTKFQTVLLFSLFSLLLLHSSCSRPAAGASVSLDFAAGLSAGGNDISAFNEQDSVVLRCDSFQTNERGILIGTSKSKSLKTMMLVFVDSSASDDAGLNYYSIVAAPVGGNETEYDLSRATLYRITALSAETAVSKYGIAFADWQAGAVSNAEKFPCCE